MSSFFSNYDDFIIYENESDASRVRIMILKQLGAVNLIGHSERFKGYVGYISFFYISS